MNNKTLIDNLRCIPDFPKKGINFRDVTTLYKNAECVQIMSMNSRRTTKTKVSPRSLESRVEDLSWHRLWQEE